MKRSTKMTKQHGQALLKRDIAAELATRLATQIYNEATGVKLRNPAEAEQFFYDFLQTQFACDYSDDEYDTGCPHCGHVGGA